MELNLSAKGKPQELILAYLQKNASEILAEKINNGVVIEKDGKRLLNKKTLDGFMKFANGEARKLAEKGANSACVEDDVVYGWAIHYFEENSIEGTLYNEDGTEYKSAPVKTTPAPTTTTTAPKPAPKPQLSMFDLLSNDDSDNDANEDADELNDEELEEEPETVVEPPIAEQKKGSPMYQHYLAVKEKYKDCIVFYRLGDFYEMFGEDAKIAADILNLTLTGRDCGLKERVPMAGVPFHAVDNYISKLVSKNYKVAVCDLLDGEMNVERVIAKQPEDNRLVDIQSGEYLSDEIEELSVEEMQQFDGDMDEPAELITVSKLIGETQDEEQTDDMISEDEIKLYFDKEVLIELFDVLGDKVDLI